MNLRTIIVDDETASRQTLRNFLTKYCQGIDIIDEAYDVPSAKVCIEKHQPDLVFLDVEMPFGNAFDLLEQLTYTDFDTIFVTAYDHYAIKALNFSASYYLLKPIDIDELVQSVEKIQKQQENKQQKTTHFLLDNIKKNAKQLVLPTLEGFEVVKLEDIIRCQANDNFTDFYFKDNSKLMICRTLKFYEELLSPHHFMRIHKSHIINLQFIKKYKKGKIGVIEMIDGSEIDLSPNKKDEFLELFTGGVF